MALAPYCGKCSNASLSTEMVAYLSVGDHVNKQALAESCLTTKVNAIDLLVDVNCE